MSEEENQSKYSSMEREYERLTDRAGLKSINSSVSTLTSQIAGLPSKIEGVRTRGYAYRSYLENKVDVFDRQWTELRTRVEEAITRELDNLDAVVKRPEALLRNAERRVDHDSMFEKLAEQAEEAIDDLKDKLDDAESNVRAIFQTLKSDVDQTYSQLREIEWVLDQQEEASFEFGAAEDVFLAADAELVLTGKGGKDPDGVLFLTNQRLVFEQKEKTGKRLGMFGGKMEQEVEWETPINVISDINIENKGMFGGKDMLNFTLSDGDMREVTVEVKGGADNKFWMKQIRRMMSGNAEDERAIEPDPEMIEALKNAPTACHVCGATLPQIMAGQTEATCQYCGTVVRLM